MRTLFFLLLLANLTLFGYIQLDKVGTGEAVRLREQVQPEKIRILTQQQVAALGPDKTAALPNVCAEWGPFGETDRVRALADIAPLGLGALVSQKRIEPVASYWVYLSPFTSRAAADRRVATLRDAGLTDLTVVENGPDRFAISLGVFRTEEAAAAQAADLARRGVANARSGLRPLIVQTALVVRDPPANAIARLKELQPAYAGTDIRIGACAKGS